MAVAYLADVGYWTLDVGRWTLDVGVCWEETVSDVVESWRYKIT
jgi:hypothetical protein